ncbi:hypothetical protein [Bacillus mycoides]|uniref:hypothetical protein n=1 Tax=Bacillus mycoides TaxID=1405 RepID=UPI0008721946|nr:hypothetical protein [Bacillus mycoides]OFD61449.1 hypothetical protein BWGOE7_37810 [Bacillus mycoides]OFD91887.1 hypothetical protein BWGOE12_38180 [Bacillus mycoides]
MDNPNKDKTCFIITPIGDDQSDIRRAADGAIDAVIVPALCEMGFDEENIKVAHRMPSPGSINKQVISSVLECDLAVANLTNLNPNVMYELAIRHAARKPVIQICQKGTRLPFDITEERTIFYTNDMAGVIELTKNFKEMVVEAIDEEEPDNPIYRVIENNTMMKKIDENDPNKFLLHRMNSLEDNLSNLINSLNSNPIQKNYFKSKSSSGRVMQRSSMTFTLDSSKMRTIDLSKLLKEYERENPDVRFEIDLYNEEIKLDILTTNRTTLLKTLDYISKIEGVVLPKVPITIKS